MGMEIHDWVTGNGTPCCSGEFAVDSTSDICFEVGEVLPACGRQYTSIDSTAIYTGLWLTATNYSPGDAIIGSDQNDYKCIVGHTSSSTTKPLTGTGWTTYWKQFSEIICADETGNTFYQRDTYDCGSYFDLGAVTDIRRNGHEHDETIFPSTENDVHLDIEQRIDDRLRCYHCTDSTGCIDPGCSDCINDGYCRFLGYDCLRPAIDSDGYIYSDVIPDPDTGIVSSEIRPGVYTTSFIDDTSVTNVFDSTNFTYYQTGGFADFDTGGMFDCTHGFDMVQITIEENLAYLLKEDGGYLLLDDSPGGIPGPFDGGRIKLEEGNV